MAFVSDGTEWFTNQGERGRMARPRRHSVPFLGPMADPECTSIVQMGEGRGSQGTSKKRHNVGEG
ncbi:hypothetical protein CYQ11_10560 [Streptomyces cinnamoneus]|nr:hypothetical protein CYQ11_10560 [Streptomyces cinnamoneus]